MESDRDLAIPYTLPAPNRPGVRARCQEARSGRVPRISRLMALAIRFGGLVNTGGVRDYAALAGTGHVSRARISQIMNLTYLAPAIQDALLFLPVIVVGPDPCNRETSALDRAGDRLGHTDEAVSHSDRSLRPMTV